MKNMKNQKNVRLQIQNMSCQGCVRRVAQVLEEIPGTHVHRVAVGEAELAIDRSQTSEQAVLQAISDAGYPARAGDGSED